MNYCPCCSESLIRQVSDRGIYWFCLHCRQEMPILERVKHKRK
ncbi:MAG: hypothetical protein QNJ54_28075 [Prochloraceae cyanobacterium]|nr:hypothetical protein [Prochloraceae cyanobacterium]